VHDGALNLPTPHRDRDRERDTHKERETHKRQRRLTLTAPTRNPKTKSARLSQKYSKHGRTEWRRVLSFRVVLSAEDSSFRVVLSAQFLELL